jgi:hypothetical protein
MARTRLDVSDIGFDSVYNLRIEQVGGQGVGSIATPSRSPAIGRV